MRKNFGAKPWTYPQPVFILAAYGEDGTPNAMNAAWGGISDDIRLISPVIIEPIQHLKVDHLGNRNPRLHTDEVLIALSICAATNPTAELAMEQLYNLRGCEVHSSVILSPVDEKVFRRLGINITCEPMYENK